jgi:hypothetical protein
MILEARSKKSEIHGQKKSSSKKKEGKMSADKY